MAFENLGDKLQGVFKKLRGKGKLTEKDIKDAMREVKLALLEADVNFKVCKEFVSSVSEKALGQQILESLTPSQQLVKIVNDELVSLMGSENERLIYAKNPPTVYMMCGLQGAGKTTLCGKLALHLKKQGKKPLLVACDVYRPAAIEQLKIVAGKAGVEVYEKGQGHLSIDIVSGLTKAKIRCEKNGLRSPEDICIMRGQKECEKLFK